MKFTTYFAYLREELIANIKNYHRTGKLIHSDKYQIGINIRSDLIFAIIHYYSNSCTSKKVEDVLFKIARKISNTLDKKDLFNLQHQNKKEFSNIYKKIIDKICPWDVAIRVIGGYKSGKSTICRLFFSFSTIAGGQNEHIPYKKNFGGKQIIFREPNDADGYIYGVKYFKNDSIFFVVLDSTEIYIDLIKKVYLKPYDIKKAKHWGLIPFR